MMRNEKWQVAAGLSDAMRLKETSQGGDLMDGIEHSNRAEVEVKKTQTQKPRRLMAAREPTAAALACLVFQMSPMANHFIKLDVEQILHVHIDLLVKCRRDELAPRLHLYNGEET